MNLNRRQLLLQSSVVLGSAALFGCAHGDRQPKPAASGTTRERKPALASEKVKEFVRVSHSDLDAVTALLEEEPQLVNATWDWGAGDFESGLGAAAHTGQREIALLLLDKGARLDIFAAAMLGRLEVVQAALTAFPDALNTPGPHGIPLIVHARMGGEQAKPVLEYLQTLS